uniref:NADP-dependent malic enzyme-like n=1 Tax=Nicotiana tabacum TaxID=4097 RepID=A0A1S4B9C5_TOBAC|nr:PREDICTED: NADP-dependent malic enzyme-like [Nicotiana tabacum]
MFANAEPEDRKCDPYLRKCEVVPPIPLLANAMASSQMQGHLPANDMLLAASEALAAQVTEEHFAKGMIYPPFGNIRKISAYIAASTVAAKAYELGVATRISRHADLVTYADESCMYTPNYRSYR